LEEKGDLRIRDPLKAYFDTPRNWMESLLKARNSKWEGELQGGLTAAVLLREGMGP